MIRPATISDLDVCVEMAQEVYAPFMRENGIEMIFEDLSATAKFFIDTNQALIVEHDGKVCGMAAWTVMPHPANSGIKIWQEALWCLKSNYKIDALLLIRAMENKAFSLGANVMVVANLSLKNEPALKRIYEKRGFNFMESHYSRREI